MPFDIPFYDNILTSTSAGYVAAFCPTTPPDKAFHLNVKTSGREGYVFQLAQLAGVSESATRLLLSVLAGYPLAAIYRIFVQNLAPVLQHAFFAICGFLLCIFNYGVDVHHSAIAISTTYSLACIFHQSPQRFVIINFVFHMTYLALGYAIKEENHYEVTWTMPHCVLVLRLIGFAFDIADWQKPRDELSKDQRETALPEVPPLVELAGFAYFPASFMIGPQFPFRRYQRFVQGEFRERSGSIPAGMTRGAVGMVYLAMRLFGVSRLPDSYLLTNEFRNQLMAKKIIDVGLWGKVALYKYIMCWLLGEGALICTGFTYAGKTDDGKDDWSGCSNVKPVLFETGTRMDNYVQSFNVNTNKWTAQYIYKRLKFLNNRSISHLAVLFFLAFWHGFYSGYYMTFFMEYAVVTAERQFEKVYNQEVLSKYGHILNTSKLYALVSFAVLKTYNIVCMGWCLIPFIMLEYDKWMCVYASLNFFGFVVYGVWVLFYFIYALVRTSEKQE